VPALRVRALILGGTTFLGLAVARELIVRGHETAIFTRGRSPGDPALPVRRYIGERDGGLAAIPREGWDAVIDTSGYVPAIVAASCAHLARAGRYLFVSSVSVYDLAGETVGEGLAPYAPRVPEKADGDPENYGPSKRRSEDVVRAVFDDRALLVRPGLIVGPHDPTNRFTYWVDRFAEGGEIAVPGPRERCVQFIDVRDLATFMVRLLEERHGGIYDVTGRPQATTMESFANSARATLAPDAEVVWLDEPFLVAHGITGWMDLPLWLASTVGASGILNTRIDRALADGLHLRSLEQTLRETRAWSQTIGVPAPGPSCAGITRARERELLDAWRSAGVKRSTPNAAAP
jgi:2'-hydroxyisoflavone reductase